MSDVENGKLLDEYDEDELVFDFDGKISRKKVLIAGGAAIGAAASGPLIFTTAYASDPLKGSRLPYKAHTGVKGKVEFWHFWSSPLRRGAVHAAIKGFNQHYPHIHVSDLPVSFGDIFNKIHAAVAAQSGVPDVVIADRPSFWIDARSRVYTSLSAYNARDKVSGKLFFPFTWYESNVKVHGKNQLFGLPMETDTRVMYVNRAALEDARLGTNSHPATWGAINGFASKLDHKSGDRYDTMTYYPLDNQGIVDIIWTNKADVQNRKQRPTLNGTRQVQSGTFMKDWIDHYGGTSSFAYLQSQNQPGKDPFSSGHLIFHIDLPTYQDFTLNQNGVQFHPKDGKQVYPYWNCVPVPHGNGGTPSTFSGGFALGMPRFDHRSKANADASWEFIKYMSLVGQLTFERFAGNIPCVISMTRDPFLKTKLHWSVFINNLRWGKPKTRNTYDPLFPGDVTGPAQDAISSGSASPKSALDTAESQALTNLKRNGGP